MDRHPGNHRTSGDTPRRGGLFWVAGFDILYALQDMEFDSRRGLHSIPVRFGVSGSLWLARIFHLIMVVSLVALQLFGGLGPAFFMGLLLCLAMLGYEHWLLRNGDLAKLDAAFFNMNGYISITIFLFTVIDVVAMRCGL